MKQTLTIATMTAMLALGAAAGAQAQDLKNMSQQERHETLKSMTPEQREEFMKARKEKWESLSDAEKVKLIEERRSEHLEAREKEWNSLSDAEKIKKAEEHMKHKKGKYGERKDHDGKGKRHEEKGE